MTTNSTETGLARPLRVLVTSGNKAGWRWYEPHLDPDRIALTLHSQPGVWSPGPKRAWHCFKTAWKARRHDVVVSQGPGGGLFTALGMRLLGVRRPHLVYTFNHGSGRFFEGWRLALARRVYGDVTYFQTHSRHERDVLARHYGLSRDRIGFLPWAKKPMDPLPPRPRSVRHLGEYALMVGRNNRDLPCLFDAAAGTGLDVVVVCPKADAAGLPVPAEVTLMHDQPREVCDGLIANAAIHLMPIASDGTGSGHQTIVASMMAAVPVVASDVPGVRDYVRDGVDGRLVRHRDPVALRAALTSLMADPDERLALGMAARTRARRRMSETAAAAHLARVLSCFEHGTPERLPTRLLDQPADVPSVVYAAPAPEDRPVPVPEKAVTAPPAR